MKHCFYRELTFFLYRVNRTRLTWKMHLFYIITILQRCRLNNLIEFF